MWRVCPLGIPLVLLTAGCAGNQVQSALQPASEPASRIAGLGLVMTVVLGLVTLTVFGLLVYAIRRPRSESPRPPLGEVWFVALGGIVVPGLVVVTLLLASLGTTLALRLPTTALTIEVTGYRWWWDVRYPGSDVVTANEIYLPIGRPIRLQLRAADVIHSFWVPALQGKMDMLPETTNTFWLQADRPGRYRGQCAEYCGGQHAHMAFWVVALAPADFDRWLAARRGAPPPPSTSDARQGRRVFMQSGCASCHTIRGTPAAGTLGPDLTHIGSRLTLGAGTLPHSPETLAQWVSDPQASKPGNQMPATALSPRDLDALQAYMATLQ